MQKARRSKTPQSAICNPQSAISLVWSGERQNVDQEVAQFAAVHYGVEHAMFEQEFRALKPLGQLLADRLLDHARAGEADQRAGFGDVEIAEHRVTGGHAAGRRVGQERDVWESGVVEPRQRRRNLGHLHQTERAFLHPRAARTRDDDQRKTLIDAALDRPRDLLADNRTHAAAHKTELHRADHQLSPAHLAVASEERVEHSGLLLRSAQPVGVRGGVDEFERVGRRDLRVALGVLTAVEEHLQTLTGTDPEMIGAGRTDVQIGFQILAINRRRAILVLAFYEDALSFDCAFFWGGRWTYFVGFALEPSHRVVILRSGLGSVKDTKPASTGPRCRRKAERRRACP